MSIADLHIHSNASDGTLPPKVIVGMAGKKNISTIAKTDHDTFDGTEEFMTCHNPYDIRRIAGIEMTTSYEGSEVHILGYITDTKPKHLIENIRFHKNRHRILFTEAIDRFIDGGLNIDRETAMSVIEDIERPSKFYIGRVLIQNDICGTWQEVHDEYLSIPEIKEIYTRMNDTNDVIRNMRKDNMIPVLAHPYLIKTDNLYGIISDMKSNGLIGIETYYIYTYEKLNKPEMNTDLIDITNELELLHSGGSDFHGTVYRNDLGTVDFPDEFVDELILSFNTDKEKIMV